MLPSRLLVCSAFFLTATALAVSLKSQPAPQGEDYGQYHRLPREVYQNMALPADVPNAPAPVPPATPRSHRPPPNEPDGQGESLPETPPPQPCHGFGCPPPEIVVAEQLLRQGPDTSQIYNTFESRANQFAVMGFVRDGWPLSIEYVAEPDTVTILRVKLYHERKILIFPIPFFEVAFRANLDALDAETSFDNPWHRTVTIRSIGLSREADAAADEGLHVARYDVRSYRIVNGAVDKSQRVPVSVIGMTVGPDVVGSLTLYAAQFDNTQQQIPVSVNPPTAMQFRYKTDTSYDLLKERIERYDDSQLDYTVTNVLSNGHSATRGQQFQSNWRLRPNFRPGRYRASILAWWRCQGGVRSNNGVLECPNDPNWAITNSGDVNLHQ